MAAVWINKHVRVGGEPDGETWVCLLCCSRAGESFLKRHTEVWGSMERPQNKYLPFCLQCLPLLPQMVNKRVDPSLVLMWSNRYKETYNQLMSCDWASLLYWFCLIKYGLIVQSELQMIPRVLKTEQHGCITLVTVSNLLTQWSHAFILLLIISSLSLSSWHDQTQINRSHCPSDAAIKLSLYLNLKCVSCHSPACKYAHVWLRGQRGRQELGRNAHFLQETAQQGGSTNHASALRHSWMHAVTQRWTMKQKGEGEGAHRKWMISLVEVWGLWWTDTQVLISCRKEIVARFTDFRRHMAVL